MTDDATQDGPQAAAGPSADPYGDAAADRRTHLLLERMHRLSPDDPRRAPLQDEIVALNTAFVRRIARRYAGRGEPLEDLLQVAYLGLVVAINRFDPDRGYRFYGYAYPVVAGEVRRHFRDKTWGVRVSRRIQELRPLLHRARSELAAANGRTPTTAELAGHIGISHKETLEALQASEAYRPLSLDALAGGTTDEDPGTVGDHLGADDPALDLFLDKHALRPLLAELPERERTILSLRFFGDQTQAQIGERLGISQMHVSRLLSQTLQHLRRGLLPG
ncbi:SigB/SigF/SigG family RNA polymerase sigma factor [Actinomadura sp. GC306]|uniref:SigB/SigF/SigG family RNA polymerase sigma factor n=1 Tax=Actinomadura sp. GC306 TaxID=2530367 RepID=UPI0010518CD1|nr:SigB/SigF/SigG family RNA polymerase sigma factor [Actinomadura sp. GC306]TDC61846.1 SigB/SigF/SigG family RNA polymerase sigma factor [Actinomadura sp. GC306]